MGIYGDIWGYINHLIFMDITMKNVNIYIYIYILCCEKMGDRMGILQDICSDYLGVQLG